MDNFDMLLKEDLKKYYQNTTLLNDVVVNTLQKIPRKDYKSQNIKIINLNIIDRVIKILVSIIMSVTVLSYGAIKTAEIYEKYQQNHAKADTTQNIKNVLNRVNLLSSNIDIANGGIDNVGKLSEENDMVTFVNGVWIYCRVIDSIEKLRENQGLWSNLPQMTEEELKESNIIIFRGIINIDGVQIEDIIKKDNKTIFVFSDRLGDSTQRESGNRNYAFYVIVPKDLCAEKFEFEFIPGTDSIEKYGFTPMSQLDLNYIKNNKALDENCLVEYCTDEGIQYNNVDSIEEFIKKYENNEDTAFRYVEYFDVDDSKLLITDNPLFEEKFKMVVIDVIYLKGKYNFYETHYGTDGKAVFCSYIKGYDTIISISQDVFEKGTVSYLLTRSYEIDDMYEKLFFAKCKDDGVFNN